MQIKFDQASRSYSSYDRAVKKARELDDNFRWLVCAREDGRYVIVVLVNEAAPIHALCNAGFCVTN